MHIVIEAFEFVGETEECSVGGREGAELARLRRRRLIIQPRVAELARLPWVFKRVALNPAKGFTPCV